MSTRNLYAVARELLHTDTPLSVIAKIEYNLSNLPERLQHDEAFREKVAAHRWVELDRRYLKYLHEANQNTDSWRLAQWETQVIVVNLDPIRNPNHTQLRDVCGIVWC